jgi:hypothetical protein
VFTIVSAPDGPEGAAIAELANPIAAVANAQKPTAVDIRIFTVVPSMLRRLNYVK